MIPTHPSDDIEHFLRFQAAAMGPQAVQERSAGDPLDIAKFKALAQLPLPPLYEAYLREFGAGDGPLKMADDANPRVKAVIELYEEQDPADPDVPERGVVIGCFGMSGERSLLYPPEPSGHHTGPVPAGEPVVIVSWWGSVGHTCAQSFRNHLYRQAFLRGRTAVGAHASLYRDDPASVPQARNLLESLGFVAYWFSDEYQVCMERDDGSTFYVERTNERTSLYGCLVNDAARAQLQPTLMARLDLRDSLSKA